MRRIARVGVLAMAAGTLLLGLPLPGSAAAATRLGIPRAATWSARLLATGDTSFADVACASPAICTAVGGGASGRAVIYRTANGGATWQRQAPPPSMTSLSAVSCPTTHFCLAQGNGPYQPYFIVTRDGGASWTYLSGEGFADDQLLGLDCVTVTICYGSEQSGLTLSRDGGTTWTDLAWDNALDIDGFSCPSTSTCFVVGTKGGSFVIERSVRFGATETIVASNPAPRSPGPAAISCPSVIACTAVGDVKAGSFVFSTSTAGKAWSARRLPAAIDAADAVQCHNDMVCVVAGTNPSRRGLLIASTPKLGAKWELSRVPATVDSGAGGGALSCPAPSKCFLAGFGSAPNSLFNEVALGGPWMRRTVQGGPGPLSAVTCASASSCVALGSGVGVWSADGGATWTLAVTPPPSDDIVNAVACPTGALCLAVGVHYDASYTPSPIVYRTTDAGENWEPLSPPMGAGSVTSIACTSPTTCVVTSAGGTSDLFQTTDDGSTWQAFEFSAGLTPVALSSVSCAPLSTSCVAVGASIYGGSVLTSPDAGASWTSATPGTTSVGYALSSVACTSSTTCWAAGDDTITPARGEPGAGIYQTIDGGAHWSQLASPGWSATGISCFGAVCQEISTPPPWYGTPISSLQTSLDAGKDWTGVSLPFQAWLQQVTVSPAGRWILVGGDVLNGALVVTSP
jgi:photosystem II stability/assembly factor-like uncharacterized protein